MIRPQIIIALFVPFLWVSFWGCATRQTASATNTTMTRLVQADSVMAVDVFEEDLEGDFGAFEDEFDVVETPPVSDPLSGYNRMMTRFNDGFFNIVLEPISRAYSFVVPEAGRISVRRFFLNLFYPLRFVNNVLQLKYDRAAIETGRFLVNSTVGLVGFFDPAKTWLNMEAYPEDFGQTLGFYGVGPGFHIVLPFLGPSNLRDTIALIPDTYSVPITYLPELEFWGTSESDRIWIATGVESYRRLNDASLQIEEYHSLRRDALDFYIFLRDAYESNRQMQIED